MSYDPMITQRLDHALKNATDRHLQMDMLLAHNKEQDIKAGAIEDALKKLQDAFALHAAEQKLKLAFMSKMIWLCFVPLAGASLLVSIDVIRNWGVLK